MDSMPVVAFKAEIQARTAPLPVRFEHHSDMGKAATKSILRDLEYYLDDGSVILRAGDVEFKAGAFKRKSLQTD